MDTLIQKNAMDKIEREELKELIGGTSITGTIVSAFTSAFKTVFEFGKSLGSSIRRIKEDKIGKRSRRSFLSKWSKIIRSL